MHQITFYVPEAATEKVKEAMFAAGAGCINHYAKCAWQTRGTGQFLPLAGSNPALGQQKKLNSVVEYKVEMVCADEYLVASIAALKQTHPYEEPAYQVVKLIDVI